MSITENFFSPKYDDAPWLSDQLLLPNLARGHSLHILAAFAPSYIFKLIDDLASSENIEPGFLNIVFFVPGDLSIRSISISRFKKYLSNYSNDWEMAKFVGNCLQLIKEGRENDFGGLQIQVQHTSQKRPLTKSLTGVILDSHDPEKYATFVDAKGGDFNSPVQIKKSWDDEEYFDAQAVLGLVARALDDSNPRASLVSSTEVEEWLIYLHNFFEENPPVNPETLLDTDDELIEDDEVDELDDDEDDEGDEFLAHLQGLEEFENEGEFGWFEDEEDFDLGPVTVGVSDSKVKFGHIPPLEGFTVSILGLDSAVARCVCGKKFLRANGCDEVMWDSYDLMSEPDFGNDY